MNAWQSCTPIHLFIYFLDCGRFMKRKDEAGRADLRGGAESFTSAGGGRASEGTGPQVDSRGAALVQPSGKLQCADISAKDVELQSRAEHICMKGTLGTMQF